MRDGASSSKSRSERSTDGFCGNYPQSNLITITTTQFSYSRYLDVYWIDSPPGVSSCVNRLESSSSSHGRTLSCILLPSPHRQTSTSGAIHVLSVYFIRLSILFAVIISCTDTLNISTARISAPHSLQSRASDPCQSCTSPMPPPQGRHTKP